MRAAHIVTKANEVVAGNVIESGLEPNDNRLQPPSKSVVKLLTDCRSKIEGTLADLEVKTRRDLEAIDKTLLTKYTTLLQSGIFKGSS